MLAECPFWSTGVRCFKGNKGKVNGRMTVQPKAAEVEDDALSETKIVSTKLGHSFVRRVGERR